MDNKRVIAVALLALVGYSYQASPDEAKNAIVAASEDAQKRLVATEPSLKQILDDPLAELKDIGNTGKETVNKILAFPGPGDKQKAVDDSVEFWKQKMEKIIKPFIDNAERNKNLGTDQAFSPPFKHNNTDTFFKHEAEIKKMFDEARSVLNKEYEKLTSELPKTAGDVAEYEWKKMAFNWPLQKALNELNGREQTFRHVESEDDFKEWVRLENLMIGQTTKFYIIQLNKWKEF